MKYLGIDYGSRRIGVAVSDESAMIAFPVGTVDAGKNALEEILAIAKENNVVIAVMGESRDFTGEKNAIMKEVEKFAEALQAKGIAVEFELEFLTSALAERQFGKLTESRAKTRNREVKLPEHKDASAAALILQSYLDRLRHREHTHEH